MATKLSERLKEEVAKYDKAARVTSAISRQNEVNRVASDAARLKREFRSQLPPRQ